MGPANTTRERDSAVVLLAEDEALIRMATADALADVGDTTLRFSNRATVCVCGGDKGRYSCDELSNHEWFRDQNTGGHTF